jgi:hypothetical protein
MAGFIGSSNMSTMYLACNNTLARGYCLGDTITIIQVAWCMVANEPHDHYILSLHDDEPLNFLWERFVRQNKVKVVIDDWPKGDQFTQYREFDQRRQCMTVHGHKYDTHKELYPRLDGAGRQGALCGHEAGLGRANVIEYYYFGQHTCNFDPCFTRAFGRGIIDCPKWNRPQTPSVFIAPWEKCQGNAVFTGQFWHTVVSQILEAGVRVTLNDNRQLMGPQFTHDNLRVVFPPYSMIFDEMSQHTVIACGNTGTGWVAAAGEYPLIACEDPHMNLGEYSFEKNGVLSLLRTIREPDAAQAFNAIMEAVETL